MRVDFHLVSQQSHVEVAHLEPIFPTWALLSNAHKPSACSCILSFCSNQKVKGSALGFRWAHSACYAALSASATSKKILDLYLARNVCPNLFSLWNVTFQSWHAYSSCCPWAGNKNTVGTTPSLHKAGNCRRLFWHSTTNKIKLWLCSC